MTNETNKTLIITPPEGYEIDKVNSTFECIKFRELPKKKEVKCWEDLDKIDGYYTVKDSNIEKTGKNCMTYEYNKNICRTEQQAEGLLALSQLSQLYYELVKDDNLIGLDCELCRIDLHSLLVVAEYIKVTDSSFLVFERKNQAIRFHQLHYNLLKQASVWY